MLGLLTRSKTGLGGPRVGAEPVFGIPDGTYFGPIPRLQATGTSPITPRHETHADPVAGAYATVSGELGVCVASTGPGVANALPGVVVEKTGTERP